MNQTDIPQNRQRILSPTQDAESISFGNWLRRQRELREISLREIADVTKISIRYLEALEQDRFDVLPAPVFAKGFLREYARYVGLDPDEVVNSYLTAQATVEPEEIPEVRGSQQAHGRLERTSGLLLTGAVVALLGIVGGLAYFLEQSQEEAEPDPPPIAAPPPPMHVSPLVEEEILAPVPSAPLIVTLDFTGECWVEAVIDDDRQISELHIAGEALRLEAEQRVVLTLGDPEVVIVEANGVSFPIVSPAGSVARDIEIDLATLGMQGQQAP
jgi:cytoskeletal protein RodZ